MHLPCQGSIQVALPYSERTYMRRQVADGLTATHMADKQPSTLSFLGSHPRALRAAAGFCEKALGNGAENGSKVAFRSRTGPATARGFALFLKCVRVTGLEGERMNFQAASPWRSPRPSSSRRRRPCGAAFDDLGHPLSAHVGKRWVCSDPTYRYVFRRTPEGVAFVPTKASSRGSTLSKKKRLPRPSNTG
jgi:hypothetical protein